VCVIPARYGSSRLPGKPLADLGGKPVIQHVCEQVAKTGYDGIVATDDERIIQAVEAFGGHANMTSSSCASGSDRVAEVVRDLDADIVVNVQGDEPFVDPRQIEEVVQPLLDDPAVEMATLCRQITHQADLDNIGVVKVVRDLQGNALYFSRSLIPYPRNRDIATWFEHVGIYAYRRDFLLEYVQWEPTRTELTESLEQLRVLDHGRKIRVVETQHDSGAPCIDTPDDLERARVYLAGLN
jgi:3-deoxy-manno-octulosonate cytidylyltransferase (CMP-KDO synthetase)